MAKKSIITKPRIVSVVVTLVALALWMELSAYYVKARNAVVNTVKGVA